MSGIVIWTYDWVPEGPRGFVRDLRLRWACEEAGLGYEVRTVRSDQRGPEHLARQPFLQVPFIDDGDIHIFESGAALLHLARKSEALMPRDEAGVSETEQWVLAALNSIEMVTMPWWFLSHVGDGADARLTAWMTKRLEQMEAVLAAREWLVRDRFTVADLMMADVLRLGSVRKLSGRPATGAYLGRVLARPAFTKAHADQIAHYEAADAARAQPVGE